MQWIKYIIQLLACLLVQILLVNHLQLGGYCHPYIYLIGLLLMPITLPQWANMLIGAGIGLLMDINTNSIGVHMSACIALMFARYYLLDFFVADKERLNSEITTESLGISNWLKYSVILVLLHHVMIFTLTEWSLDHWFHLTLEIVISTIVSLLLILSYTLIHDR